MPHTSLDRVLVVIPAWNEEDALPGVLDEVRAVCAAEPHLSATDVLVVSDGSRDGTAAVARSKGVPVLDLPINLGVGGAMRAGFKFALRNGYDGVVQLDADGQHDPRAIPSLLAAAREHGADVVIGARFAGAGSYEARGPRRAAMRVLARVLSRVTGTPLTDTTSGFKLAGPRAIPLFASEYPAEYLGDTVESLVIAARAGLVVRQVPVAMRERQGGRPSHSPLKAAVFLGRAVLALGIALSRPTNRTAKARFHAAAEVSG
ncbi:glycosyltransferase family 2 protein [Cellulomonas hominis]|uniref:glycosyltransferase family 2 protein n=1 Tax=Cellulomonas hominis TaxID=156981 RepID=UPI001B8F3FBE|nr:glycosyltransferase family 2 protein [Cellulomonas hominis]VTR76219.1 Undecaprenyl-phosphate mannosyltransferase [Cellulomonas hominis]